MEKIEKVAEIIKEEIPEWIEVPLDKVVKKIKSILKENEVDFFNLDEDNYGIIRDAIIDGVHSCSFEYIPHIIIKYLYENYSR